MTVEVDYMSTEVVLDQYSDFDLDISIVESGPVLTELVRLTDDNCGHTCESACTSCP